MILALLAMLSIPTGKPTIVVPMYVRCPTACLTITRDMKKAVARADADPSSYDVVLFSFDPRDTPADIRRFATRERVPANWTLMTGNPQEIERLMDQIGFRYMKDGGGFAHPSVAAIFSSRGNFVKTMAGDKLDIDAAVKAARTERDWIRDYGGYALVALLMICVGSLVYALAPARDQRGGAGGPAGMYGRN